MGTALTRGSGSGVLILDPLLPGKEKVGKSHPFFICEISRLAQNELVAPTL